jgi:hypothetical protein
VKNKKIVEKKHSPAFLQAKQWNERTSITNILQTIETEVEEESKKGRERARGKVTDSVYISNPKGQKEAKLKSKGKLTTLKLKNLKGCIGADLSKRKDREPNSNGCEIS